jgi:tRNA threonylcarbamoyladenosine modification (KEOPS) complex Cgi121 subunit
MHYVAFVIDANGNALNARNAGNNVSQTFEIE